LSDVYVAPPARVVHRPMHPLVIAFPLAAFLAGMIADIAYVDTLDTEWLNFADWLLAGAMILGVLAAIVGLIDLSRRSVRANRLLGPYAVLYAIAMIIGLFDNLVHSRDAYGVMPTGLTLSVLTVIVLTIASFLGALLLRRPAIERAY
jgi:uncharacterized membrane protein